jgi:small-conductance mechanosensitive channel
MTPPRLTPLLHRWLPLGWLLAVLAASPLSAQVPGLPTAAEGEAPAKPAAPEPPAAHRAKLEQLAKEARDALTRLDAPDAAAALPAGITPAELDERRRTLEQLILAINRGLKNLTVVEEARKALETSRAREAAWTGFKKKPPYSLLMIDDLLNEREAIKSNLASAEASLANYERLLVTIHAEAKTAKEAESSALGAVQSAGADTVAAAKWRLEAALTSSRLLAARADLFQSMIDSQKDRIAAAKADLTLLERQVAVAKANASFSDEDLANLAKLSDERKRAIRKELDGQAKRLKAALTARSQAQAALDALGSPTPAGGEPPDLDLAQYRLEVAEGRVETMQSLIEGLEGLLQLEDVGMKAYHDRRALAAARTLQQRVQALDSLGVPREHLWAWVNVLDDEVARTSAELTRLEARAATLGAEDPRSKLLTEQRANTSEKLAMLQRLAQAVETQRTLVKRWILEYSPETTAETGFWQQLDQLGSRAASAVKKVWSFEVLSFEDKVEVDGRTITGRIPVTLGMLLRAVLFFLVGYWLASLIARRIQAGLVTRGHLAEAQARTLRNWAMIVIGAGLVIGTLAVMRIPLTVFAFLGGALAIGLGFGTQTLLKNFVSGIIVLAERKVRVGDIVDVDGIVGTITEINTRSSVVRGPDDVETLIPNSVLLDNRVSNSTLSNQRVRRSLRVGVAYGTPPAKVMTILTEVAGRHGLVCKEPAPFAVFEDFGESALVFTLYFWLELPGSSNPMIITSDLRLMIEKRFSEAGCGVPFPQRDIHLAASTPLQVQWLDQPAGPAPAKPPAPAK